MTASVGADGRREVHEGIELLELTRSRDCQQAFDSTFALLAPGAEHDLSPLNRGPECALGRGMPRAGLCRVGEFSPGGFGAHFAADAA